MDFLELSGDPIARIVAEAREKRATLLVIGGSTRNTWKERFLGSFTDKIIQRLDGLDIYIVGNPVRPNYWFSNQK
jgi:nucleotide-binding universal stress UspA family protein